MTESRIGIIKSVTTSDVTIHWNSDGPATYVFDELPDDLVLAKGRVVHAKCRRDGRIVSARSEPAYMTNAEVVAADLADPHRITMADLPDANWPKVQ